MNVNTRTHSHHTKDKAKIKGQSAETTLNGFIRIKKKQKQTKIIIAPFERCLPKTEHSIKKQENLFRNKENDTKLSWNIKTLI